MYNNCAKTLCIHNNCAKTLCIQSVPVPGKIYRISQSQLLPCVCFVFGEMIGMGFLTFQNFNTRMESFFSSFLIQYPVWKNSAKELSASVHSVEEFVYKNMFISMT